MPTTKTCKRCGRNTERLDAAPVPGPVGQEVREHICPTCWAEWQQMEVMVINELRLNFMDPGAQEILDHHMREFLGLAPGAGEAS